MPKSINFVAKQATWIVLDSEGGFFRFQTELLPS